MRNTVTFRNADGEPVPGLAVELYEWQASSPYYADKIGDFTDLANGQYYIDITDASVRATILVDSVVQTAFIGIKMDGDIDVSIPDGSITTAMLADGAVTPPKTSFAENW